MSLRLQTTPLPGLWIAETTRVGDHRGSFGRLFCDRELSECLGTRRIVQINHSVTQRRGAVRGLHYQRPPYAEMKLVRCLRGSVFDVAVDLRRGSPTFLSWHAQILSAENQRMLVIPEGCAHGFQVLEPDSELLYLHTAPYTPEAEGGIGCQESVLAIEWPLPVEDLSVRDRNYPPIPEGYTGIELP